MPRIGAGKYRKLKTNSYAAEIVVHEKRLRRRFTTSAEAVAWLENQTGLRTANSAISESQLLDATEALRIAGDRVTLTEAVKLALHHQDTIREASHDVILSEYLRDCHAREIKAHTIKNYRVYLTRFLDAHSGLLLTAIQHQHITEWLRQTYETPATRNAVRRYLNTFFEFCQRHQYVYTNPCAYVAMAKRRLPHPEFYPVDEVTRFMRTLEWVSPELVPYHAVAFWTGARPHELQRLESKQIGTDEILLRADQTKTGQKRFVPVPDNLRAWLEAYKPGKRLSIPQSTRIARRRRTCAALGLQWIQDGTRHTFASMHVAAFENPGLTATILGHTNQELLWRHYRGAVRREEAVRYWEVGPG